MSAAPQAAPAGPPDKDGGAAVKIDRLVLDIPGLDPPEAEALATDIGERLARTGMSGDHATIGITLGPIGGSRAELAARITAALMERLV
ncbi:MAG TPA: hypothetical protein VKS60_19940 [Stellaceae bacterium]|nr:hypothetical protein [Stellaceae bacterium]